MTEVVLDASALLASLFGEPGNDKVDALLDRARISSVNLAEVVTRLAKNSVPQKEIEKILEGLELHIEYFDARRAIVTGMLAARTSKAGLSLGDRACLSLAAELKLPALTADKVWRKVDCDAEVVVIR